MSERPAPSAHSNPHPTRKKPTIPPEPPTLKCLPRILFDHLSNENGYTDESLELFFWKKVSIFTHPEIAKLSLQYVARVRRLYVPSSSITIWISYSEGYVTNSFCILVSENGINVDAKNPPSTFKPILIIEAGHRIPVQAQGVTYTLDETVAFEKIKQRLLESKPKRIVELQRRTMTLYRKYAETLPRTTRKNPMYDNI